MIEIKITFESALNLLIEQMNFEFRNRQKSGIFNKALRIEDLSYKELIKIVDTAIIDIVFLLPFDFVTKESNLIFIITEAVKALAKIFNKEEFLLFSARKAKILLHPLKLTIHKSLKEDCYKNN